MVRRAAGLGARCPAPGGRAAAPRGHAPRFRGGPLSSGEDRLRIGILHGPNLRLLGVREPEVYGRTSLDGIDASLQALADELDVGLETFQSNHEGELLDFLEDARERLHGLVVNAGALTHTSVALRDALAGIALPFVEVHLSNTAAREAFRRHSYLAPVAAGVVYGFGGDSYLLGLRGLVGRLRDVGER